MDSLSFDDLIPQQDAAETAQPEPSLSFDDLVPQTAPTPAPAEAAITPAAPAPAAPAKDLGWSGDLAAGWEMLKQSVAAGKLAGAQADLESADKPILSGRGGGFQGDAATRRALASKRVKEAVSALGESAAELKNYPEAPSVQKFNNAQSFSEAFSAFAEDPLTVARSTVLRSAPSSIPSVVGGIIGSVAGPGGAAVLAGSGSMMTEFGSAIADGLQEKGADLEDPESIAKVWQLHGKEISQKAQVRSGIIGSVDALTAGAGSKIAALGGGTVAREIGKFFAGTTTQALGGAAGEAGAQVATGEQLKPGAILGEVIGEVATGGVETVGQMAVESFKPSQTSELGPSPDQAAAMTTTSSPSGTPPIPGATSAPAATVAPDQAQAIAGAPVETPRERALRIARERDQRAAAQAAAQAARTAPAAPVAQPAPVSQPAASPTATAGTEPSAAVGVTPTAPPPAAPAPAPAPAEPPAAEAPPATPNEEITTNVPAAPTEEVPPSRANFYADSPETIKLQHAALRDPKNDRKAVVYSADTSIKDLPDKPQGKFIVRRTFKIDGVSTIVDFNTAKTNYGEVQKAIRTGKLNELLDLGPYNQQQVAESASAGAAPVAVTERTPDGTEVKTAAGTEETAPEQVQVLEETKSAPENTVQVEDPRQVAAERQATPKRKITPIKQPGEGYRIGQFSFDFNERGGARYVRVRDRSGRNLLQSKDGGAPEVDVTDIWSVADPNQVEKRQGSKVGINSLGNNVPTELVPVFRDYLEGKIDSDEALARISNAEIGGSTPAAKTPVAKAEQAKATSKAREEKAEAAPPKPRVLQDLSPESQKAKQEQAEQNEVIADRIKPFLAGRGKTKTLKNEAESKGKSWTPAERIARRRLNVESEQVADRFAPTPAVDRVERDFLDTNASKRDNARAAIRARAEAMLAAADEAGLSLPEKVSENTDVTMNLGRGPMNLIVARDFLKALRNPYKNIEDHYTDFLSRDMRLRKGLLDEVVSERRTEIDDKMRGGQGGDIEQIAANPIGDTTAEADTELSAETPDAANPKIVGKDDIEARKPTSAKMAPKIDDATEKGEITLKTKDGKGKKVAADVAKPASAGRVYTEEEKKAWAKLAGVLKREDGDSGPAARDLNDADVLQEVTLADAIAEVGEAKGNAVNRSIINRLLARIARNIGDTPVKVVDQATLDEMFPDRAAGRVDGFYDPQKDHIVVSANFLKGAEFDARLLAHEGLHAYLQRAVDSDATLQADIQQILDYARGRAPAAQKNSYGFKDVQEFLAEAMSNPDFQNLLMSIRLPDALARKYDAPTGSLWQGLVSAVRKHLGLGNKDVDALSYAMRLVERAEDRRGKTGEADLVRGMREKGLLSERQPQPIFYSAVRRVVENIKQGKAAAGQWMGMIKNAAGVKPEELEFLGLEDWLKSQDGPVTKQQLLNYIAANELQVSEVTATDIRTPPEVSAAQDRYNDLWDIMQSRSLTKVEQLELSDLQKIIDDFYNKSAVRYSSMKLAGPSSDYREMLITLPDKGGEAYEMDLHWPGRKNFVAHVRFDERVDAQGRRVLFINELQSDWHSEGRRSGYRKPLTKEQIRNLKLARADYDAEVMRIQNEISDIVMRDDWDSEANIATRERLEAEMEKLRQDFVQSHNEATRGVPDAPFKTTWNELAMKRMARWAADNDFDVIAWPSTPEQVAEIEKWPNLRKEGDQYFVDGGNKDKNVTGIIESYTKYLPRTVDKMFKKFGAKTVSTQLQPSGKEVYRGDVPTISGMVELRNKLKRRGEYDVAEAAGRLVNYMQDGLALELALSEVRYSEGDGVTDALIDAMGGEIVRDNTQPNANAIVITPEMASSVLQGQPLFRERSYADELKDAGVPDDVAAELDAFINEELGKAIDPATLPLFMGDLIKEYGTPASGGAAPPAPPASTPARAGPKPKGKGTRRRGLAIKLNTLDYLRQKYNPYFDNLIDPYVKEIQKRENTVSEVSDRHDKVAAEFLDLMRRDRQEAVELANIAMEATRFDVRVGPNADNSHLGKDAKRGLQGKKRLSNLNARFANLKPPTQELYRRMTESYRETHNNNIRALAYNVLTSLDTKLSNSDLMMLMEKVVDGTLTEADAQLIGDPDLFTELRGATSLKTIKGDYFPQMRFGDFVVLTTDTIPDPGVTSVTLKGKAGTQVPVKTSVDKNVVRFQIDPTVRGAQTALDRAVNKYIEENDLTLLRASKRFVDKQSGQIVSKGEQATDRDYDVVIEVELQNQGVNFFDNRKDAEKFRKQVGADEISEVLDRREDFTDRLISGSALTAVTKRIEARTDIPEYQRKQMRQAVQQAIISQMPGNRAQSRYIARRNVKGASTDIARAAVTYGQAAGNYYATLVHAPEIRKAFNKLSEFVSKNKMEEGAGVRSQVMNELQARQETMDDPLYLNKFMQNVAALSFFDKLVSPAYSIINFQQAIGNGLPYLGGQYGNTRAALAISNAYRKIGTLGTIASGLKNTAVAVGQLRRSAIDTTDLVGSIRKNLGPKYDALLDELIARGLVSPNSGFEIGQAIIDGSGAFNTGIAKFDRIARQLPNAVEAVNRTVVAVATFDLATSRGKSIPDAIQEAYDAVANTQGDYRTSNNPRFMRNRGLSWALQFKKYAMLQTQLVGDMYVRAFKGATKQERAIARKQLATMIAVQTLYAGALGLPGLEIAKLGFALAAMLGVGDGWDDFEEDVKKLLDESIGQTWSELLRKGVLTRAIGIDVSQRMSQADLWTGFMPDTLDRDGMMQYAGSLLLGAPGSTLFDWFDAARELGDGNIQKALEKLIPIKAVADTMRAVDQVQRGKMTVGEAIAKSIGFQPARMANIGDEIGAEIRENKKISQERSKLYKDYINATSQGELAKIKARVREFNAKQGKNGRKISIKSLERARKRELERYSD